MPVIAALEFDDLRPAGEPPGESYAAHGGLGAAVHHAHFLYRRHHAADCLGHFDLQRIRRAKAQSAPRRFTHCLDDRLGRVTKNRRAPSSHKIDQLAVIHRGQSATPCRLHKKRLASHAPEGPHRRVHPAGDAFFCGFEKLSGCGHGKSGLRALMVDSAAVKYKIVGISSRVAGMPQGSIFQENHGHH